MDRHDLPEHTPDELAGALSRRAALQEESVEADEAGGAVPEDPVERGGVPDVRDR